MHRSIPILLLGLLVVGGLVVFELNALGILGGDDGEDAATAPDLLGAEGEEAAKAATLQGRGGEGGDADATAPVAVDPTADLPPEARGGTPNGASVRGRVVRKQGGVPLAGVRVTLDRPDSIITYLRAQANGRFDRLEVRTGADGRFAFLDVTPSKGYVVRARHPGHAVASTPEPLDLTGREAVDVGDLVLGQGGTLTGRVLGPGGEPLRNVRVAATWRIANPIGIILADPDTAPELEAETTTGADGRWTLARLDPQPKTLFAVAPGGATQVVRSVSLEEGQLKEVDDIRLPGPGVIAGTVRWEDGAPIVGARVFAAPRMQAAVRTVETDAEGAFRLTWLPEAEPYVLGTLVEGLPVDLRMGVSLGDEDVEIVFPRAGSLRGVVVTADGGRPVRRFAVQLDRVEEGETDWQRRFMTEQVKRGLGPTPFVSDDGSFHLPRVAAGTWIVTVSAPGYPDTKFAAATVVAGEEATVRVEVPRGHVARGTVRRADGSPFEGARVYVVRGVPDSWDGAALTDHVEDRTPDAVTGADGTFTLPPQTPGTCQVVATHPSALPAILRAVDLGEGDVDGLELRLPPAATIHGRVLRADGTPAGGESVYVLYPDGTVRVVETTAQGGFETGGLPVGRCLCRWVSLQSADHVATLGRKDSSAELRARAYDALRRDQTEHVLRDGQALEVTVQMPPLVLVTGRYRIGGVPPPEDERSFVITVPGASRWRWVPLDEHGAFETRLRPGRYMLHGPGAGDGWEGQPVEIPDAASFVLDVDR